MKKSTILLLSAAILLAACENMPHDENMPHEVKTLTLTSEKRVLPRPSQTS